MTDNDLLAQQLDKLANNRHLDHNQRRHIERAATALRARDTELAAARTLLYDLAGPDWLTAAAGLALQERARAWLASVSPPANSEEGEG